MEIPLDINQTTLVVIIFAVLAGVLAGWIIASGRGRRAEAEAAAQAAAQAAELQGRLSQMVAE